jgi:hypothetical protein
MGFTGWSQRDTLTTGHGHCRDNRRQHTREIAEIVNEFSGRYRLHGFGVKTDGLGLYGPGLWSADSQAWSEGERRRGYPLFPECVGVHGNCANCPKAALWWRRRVLNRLASAGQPDAGSPERESHAAAA